MKTSPPLAALILGLLLAAGLMGSAWLVGDTLLKVKSMDRTVNVKGLAEKEVSANIAIWPIQFTEVDNDLKSLYRNVESKTAVVVAFLKSLGFQEQEITVSLPNIEDRQARGYVDPNVRYRYFAKSTVSVYTNNVEQVRLSRGKLTQLLEKGITISTDDYQSRVEYLFTGLNEIKPEMIQLATRNAREVAEKFARDSDSRLGKIKTASQGQFIISDRDSNTPYIKNVRVVSTLTYYLTD
ncbi:MAG: SIMPL domain-containing protein [Shewanella sp.]|nr:SIMPL domain-containing protein [Shewanella sp.]MCF1430180.1 SIMPL domain-containing protein [Shewanella sp.]MCF1437544.1 SIMPL domain-containing protein [Shewanella sp.]MCF1456588.1 SIMPL domain-containing protein [Shewanella sp.]